MNSGVSPFQCFNIEQIAYRSTSDSNNEITMLRDQMARSIPTPPSSVSAPMSPVQAPTKLPPVDIPSSSEDEKRPRPGHTPTTRTPFPKSNTTASLASLASPSVRRTNTGMTKSPSGLPSLARSTNTRNLANVAGPSSPSPFARTQGTLSTTKGRSTVASPVRVVSSTSAKTKGFRLLHELQAKLKATDDKLGTKVPKRNVSNPMPLAPSKRTISSATTATTTNSSIRAPHARVQALAGDTTSTPSTHEKSSILSPNGWILVDDENTPTNQIGMNYRDEPSSPLETFNNNRAASQASSKSTSSKLPSRPGIPSPLTTSQGHGGNNPLQKSTTRLPQRTPSRAGISNLYQSIRPQSRTSDRDRERERERERERDHDRPMSPSMIPRPSSSMMHALSSISSTVSGNPKSQSHFNSNSAPRAHSQTAHRTIGRGPPPKAFPGSNPIKSSISTTAASNPALKRSTRRSSVGTHELQLSTSTGLPQPRTPNRPVSVPVFHETPPPPVPRIPSVHLRESKRGPDPAERRKSLLNR